MTNDAVPSGDGSEDREEHRSREPHGADERSNGSPSASGGKDEAGSTRRGVVEIRPPELETVGVLGVGRRVAAGMVGLLDWVLTHFTSPAVMSAVIGLVVYAYVNRDAVRVLPFENTTDGTARAVQLGQLMDAVDRGARAGVDEGLDFFKCTTAKPPDVAIPGTGISLTSLVSWGETQVQGEIVDQGKLHQVRLHVSGAVSGIIETDFKSSVDDALVEGAERLYALIVPVNGAYYYFSRYPDRSLELLQGMFDRGRPSTALYRVWGLSLRNLGDVDGALDAFRQADAEASDPKEHAHLHVEMGYVARMAKHWDAAVEYFDRAAKEDPTWPVPVVRKADALRDGGRSADALGSYEQGGTIQPSFADAWAGMGDVYATQGDHALAIVAYETARRFAFDPVQRASLLRDEGDVLFDLGCVDEAGKRYASAMGVLAVYDPDRGNRPGGACPTGAHSAGGDASACFAYES
jgi:Tfp pilus assembly protein PilF